MDVNLLFDRNEGNRSIEEDVFLIECSNGCWKEFVGIYLMFVYFCMYRLFLSETGEAFSEECPSNKRDWKTLEKLILKRVRLGDEDFDRLVEFLQTFSRARLCCFCML